eukprot:838309-Heterocapsa_arctica.AAC.1
MTKAMTTGIMDRMQNLETRLDDMTTIHEETKMLINQGFKEQERAFDEEHQYNSKNHKKLEDGIER